MIDISDKVNLLSGHTLSDIIATKYKNHIHIEIAMQLDTYVSAKFIAQVANDIFPNGKVAISSLCATNENNVISSAYIGADGRIYFIASANVLYAYVTADYITKGG